MKATKNWVPLAHRYPSSIRIAIGGCLVSGLLTLGGCATFETATTHTVLPDNRIRLGWRDPPVSIHRRELDNYACLDGLPLQCESVSGKSLCHCPRR